MDTQTSSLEYLLCVLPRSHDQSIEKRNSNFYHKYIHTYCSNTCKFVTIFVVDILEDRSLSKWF
jgi:hypothetical protein